MHTDAPAPDDVPLTEFKRLDVMDGEAVLTLLGRSGEAFRFRLPGDQLDRLSQAIKRDFGRLASPAFPLDAEQIVRALGFLAAQHFDRTGRPGDARIDRDRMTLAIGRFLGVPLPVVEEPCPAAGRIAGRTVLLPYGATPNAAQAPAGLKPETGPPRTRGGSDAV